MDAWQVFSPDKAHTHPGDFLGFLKPQATSKNSKQLWNLEQFSKMNDSCLKALRVLWRLPGRGLFVSSKNSPRAIFRGITQREGHGARASLLDYWLGLASDPITHVSCTVGVAQQKRESVYFCTVWIFHGGLQDTKTGLIGFPYRIMENLKIFNLWSAGVYRSSFVQNLINRLARKLRSHIKIHEELVFSRIREVFSFMVFGPSGNVNDPPNPFFSTLDTPHYSK